MYGDRGESDLNLRTSDVFSTKKFGPWVFQTFAAQAANTAYCDCSFPFFPTE